MSKAWNWAQAEKAIWMEPSVECYYLDEHWRGKGYHNLLDLGCGLGRHSVFFARKGFRVTASDLSTEAVAHTQLWAEQEGLSILTRTADMLALPFDDKSFDCIFSYNTISHTDTAGIHQVIGEIKRLLRPSGEFYVTLCSKDTWAWAHGQDMRIDENTIVKDCEPEHGIPHFHVSYDEIPPLFASCELLGIRHITDYYLTPSTPTNAHYFIHGLKLHI